VIKFITPACFGNLLFFFARISTMQISRENIDKTCNETDLFKLYFDFCDKRILELGCGSAMFTRSIAEADRSCHIDALEVDEIQYDKNLQINDLANVNFMLGGAEQIPSRDNHYDQAFLFKSLHHVPLELLDSAMQELRRVLKPGGKVWISEPIYAGDFNELVSLFHDEKKVREAAFDSIKHAVQEEYFQLEEQLFFNTEVCFDNFRQFEEQVIGASFADHKLNADVYEKVKARFSLNMNDGMASFTAPMRVDLLVK